MSSHESPEAPDAAILRERLSAEMFDIEAEALRPHAKRGALVIVDGTLDLIAVGVAVAMSRAALVTYWLNAGLLRKIDEAELDQPATAGAARFRFIIVQPFVLAQALRN